MSLVERDARALEALRDDGVPGGPVAGERASGAVRCSRRLRSSTRVSPSEAHSFPRPPRSRAWSGGRASSARKRRQTSASVRGSNRQLADLVAVEDAGELARPPRPAGSSRRPSTVSASGRTARCSASCAVAASAAEASRPRAPRRPPGARRVERDAAGGGLAGPGERRDARREIRCHRLDGGDRIAGGGGHRRPDLPREDGARTSGAG